MPYRKVLLVPGEIYHVFNRTVARQPIFLSNKDYHRAIETLYFYSFIKPDLRYSHYNRFPQDQKDKFLINLGKKDKQVQILAFCLMPNHFHFLIKEVIKNGTANFIKTFQGSYAKYFNLKSDRNGALFQSRFKAVRIESDEQFIHVARYIHLNPLTAYLIKDIEELKQYPWTSFPEYIEDGDLPVIKKDQLLGYFSSVDDFVKFTSDQIDYQRKLNEIKHLIIE